MQKHHLLAISIALSLITSTTHAGWWSNDNEEKQRRIQIEQQLNQQRKETGGWQIVAGTLAVFTGIAFTVGTILGSRARRKGGDDK
jgi:4-alpha-glucanotransferase